MATAPVLSSPPTNQPNYTPAEMRARSIVSRLESVSAKLKTLEDDMRAPWVDFDNLKAGETILGCSTKKEFCETKLGRTPRALQYMLAGGNPGNLKRSEIISPPPAPSGEALPGRMKPAEPESAPEQPPIIQYTSEELARSQQKIDNEGRLSELFNCDFSFYIKQNCAINEPHFNVVFSALTAKEVERLAEVINVGIRHLQGQSPTDDDPTPNPPTRKSKNSAVASKDIEHIQLLDKTESDNLYEKMMQQPLMPHRHDGGTASRALGFLWTPNCDENK